MNGPYEQHDVANTSIEPQSDTSPAPASASTHTQPTASTRRTWWIAGFAVGLALVGIQLLVTQPLERRLDGVQSELVRVEQDMSELVGAGNGAWETNDLLSGLQRQSDQLDATRSALETIRSFREQVQQQAAGVDTAREVLEQLAALQDRLVDDGAANQQAVTELNRLVAIRDLAIAHTDQTDQALKELARWNQVTRHLGNAHESINQLVALRDAILAGTTETDQAQLTLDRLVILQDTLNSQSEHLANAQDNLDQLLTLQNSLGSQSDAIADSIVTLETLTDLQQDIRGHVDSLQGMRRDLMEVVLLESSVARVVRMLGPLTELVKLRRLGNADLQAAARSISKQRTTRHAKIPPRTIPDTRGDDPDAGKPDGPTPTQTLLPTTREIPANPPADRLSGRNRTLNADRIVPPPAETTRIPLDQQDSTPESQLNSSKQN